ncbi:unnamed protein product [Trichobilharzia szidati]|nr:unnamed protein product [Trichobilharzia szidati]
MNITDMQSSKSEWNNDCTTGYIPQEHMDDNSQSKTLLDNMTSTYDQLQNPNKKTKLTYSYEKTTTTTLLLNSTSSSSSSPSLSFNRPKSSSPSHEDSNYLMLNDLMNSSDNFIHTTTTTTTINDASKNLNQANILLNNNNSENTSNMHISNQEDNENNENTNDTVDEDEDDDDDDNDGDRDEDGDGDVDVCCYNPSMVISDKAYSQMSSFKQTNDRCSLNTTTNNNDNNNYESRENDTYLSEITDNNNNNSNMKDVYLINNESTDMIPLVKKQRYSSSNDLNPVNALNEHEAEQLSSNTRISTSISQGILTPLDKSSAFQRIEYSVNQALSSNESIPSTQNDFRMNESNESIQLNNNNNNHTDYKFKEFQSHFEYPSQYHLNYPNIHTNTTINNSSTVTGDHHPHPHQSHYPLNSPHRHHQHHHHLQEEQQHRQQIKDYSSCSTSSPLQNYFPSSLPFEHLSRYSDYNNNNNITSKNTDNNSNNNIGFIKESNRLNLNSAQNELINHSMFNKDIEHLRKSIMNKTIPPLNNINDNYNTEKLLTFNQSLNSNNNNTLKHTPHLSSISTTTTNEHLLNNRHIEPPFPSVISNNLNENIIPRLVSHSIVTPLQSNHSSSRTIPSYPRNINECTENLSRLGHLNWASNNSNSNNNNNNSSHPYNRGQTGYSTEFTNTTRRRNATKESTTTLKAWLQEHIKNPYPTKGEKIMLAIITKMTLTQVSTWFANARRRLKKENKMTWTPKHRGEEQADDEDDDDDDGDEDGDEDDMDDAGDNADANGHVDENEAGDDEVGSRRVNQRHRDDRNRKEGKHRNVDNNNNPGDNDQEDEMTGSDEELNIMELASSQNRNHSALNNYFKNYSSDKHNKSMVKPDLFKTNFHENESYNSINNNNSLMNMKKFDEFHHFPLISSYPTPNTSFLMNQIQPNLNATTTTTNTAANATFDSLFNEQYDKMNLTLNQLNTFNKNQCAAPHKAFENNIIIITPTVRQHI